MAHDAYSCNKYPNSRPFPTRRPADYQHVGQVCRHRHSSYESKAKPYQANLYTSLAVERSVHTQSTSIH
eukprot:scaffold72078_cov51-Phaeocystis_antarctica.AAC.1